MRRGKPQGGVGKPEQVLYPNDEQVQGKELRLEQQYFVSCSLQDMFRILRTRCLPVDRFQKSHPVE
jgi:starch phosphorylase